MTNEEGVIKALEEFHHRILKTNLSYHIRESEMMAIVDVIDLINRLNTDYEHIKNEHRETLTKLIELCDIIEKQKAEIETLNIQLNNAYEYIRLLRKQLNGR